mmetsp:Transcript_15789/g.24035  ORF Transcript_15789/g.24035 Transcript_15789/m.24035 type:complete len:151 (-) Transcript_15789:414-866(-)
MSRDRFDKLLSVLVFADSHPPPYKDPFAPINQLVDAWNKNMSECFSSGYITCLDESMSPWMSQFTCPGFMFVPRKPWLFGNEWYTIACGHSKVMFQVELVKGKDFQRSSPAPIQQSRQNCRAAPSSYETFVGNGQNCSVGLWLLCSSWDR